MSRLSTLAVLIGLSIACSGRERINQDCQWTHDARFQINLRESVHQRHLRYDADLMEDLAIRYADEHAGRVARFGFVKVRDECMSKLFAVIAEYHGVWKGRSANGPVGAAWPSTSRSFCLFSSALPSPADH